MKAEFLDFLYSHELVKAGDRILLAVSGGVDSMVMVDLFRTCGFSIGVAHVNYQLRGHESDADEKLVKNYCDNWKIPFFSKKIEPSSWNEKNIQVQARALRYHFFEESAATRDYTLIATAHHKDDALETYLLNSIRGTGIEGLQGIPLKRNRIIRPLLFTNKQEIRGYALEQKISFREDLTNLKNDYIRNKIRNQVLPVLEEMHQRKRTGFYNTLEYVKEDNLLFNQLLQQYTSNYWTMYEGYRILDIEAISNLPLAAALLYQILKPYGFQREQTEIILKNRNIGATFHGRGWIAVIEKMGLILYDQAFLQQKKITRFCFDKFNTTVVIDAEEWSLQHYAREETSFLPDLPVTVRPWKSKDVFRPYGMKGKTKEVKKIISESNVPLLYRPFILVLEDANHTIWAILPHQVSLDLLPINGMKPSFDVIKNGTSVLFKK